MRGRTLGTKCLKIKYEVKYLSLDENSPQWHVYYCTSYDDIKKQLQDNHSVTYTRDILQNMCLKRNTKLKKYPNLQVKRARLE